MLVKRFWRSRNVKVRRPVLIAIGKEERSIIGYTTLELLGFKVNPVT